MQLCHPDAARGRGSGGGVSEPQQIYGVDVALLPEPYRTQVRAHYPRLLAASQQGLSLATPEERLLRRVYQWLVDYQVYFGKMPGAD